MHAVGRALVRSSRRLEFCNVGRVHVVLPQSSSGSFLPVRTITSRPPGSDPLDLLHAECIARKLCTPEGHHIDGAHWVMALAISSCDASMPPNLRTVGISRISRAGVDFVLKRGSNAIVESIGSSRPIAILHHQGRFVPGEKAEQWRAEGRCHPLALNADLVKCIPDYTLASMIASSRIAAEDTMNAGKVGVSDGRLAMLQKSHVTEVMQITKLQVDRGEISLSALEQYVSAYRFQPDRMECMLGSPDTVMWERWEWIRDKSSDGDDAIDSSSGIPLTWMDPKQLVPH